MGAPTSSSSAGSPRIKNRTTCCRLLALSGIGSECALNFSRQTRAGRPLCRPYLAESIASSACRFRTSFVARQYLATSNWRPIIGPPISSGPCRNMKVFVSRLVEAMWFDVPVLAFKSSVSRNARRSGLMFSDKSDLQTLAGFAHLTVTDEDLREKVIAAQRRAAPRFLCPAR